MIYVTRYAYEDLLQAALAPAATAADLSRLAEWFERYGSRYWNGECYALEDGKTLWPIDRETAPDEWERVGWEIR